MPNFFQTLVASFIVSGGWNWYHLSHRPTSRFVFFIITTAIVVYIGYYVFKWLYHSLTWRFSRHVFWQKEFGQFLDDLFFYFSLFFLVFFSNDQALSLVLFLVLMGLFFYKTQTYISHHPQAAQWQVVHKSLFKLLFFLFIFSSIFQYVAFRLINFDAFLKFHNIVLFRAWAISMFWMLGFAVTTLIYWKTKGIARYIALGVWTLLYVLVLTVWYINIGIMYFSGLYFSPLMLEVTDGSSAVVFNVITAMIALAWVATIIIFGLLLRSIIRSYQNSSFRQWGYYSLVLIAVALASIFGLSSFKNTPEFTIARNFYNYFLGKQQEAQLSPVVREKLERFGLRYNLEDFNITHKETIFNSQKNLLPEQFKDTKPNIIFIFFESFSSRLTSVYNKNWPGLTPGLEDMAADTSTIIFKNYFNASTPTINGILAQLCSFLPPTGYTEIEVEKNLQRLRLQCLPTILKESGGYKSATYITAVAKEFENKDAIFGSMDTESVFGQQELKNIISGEPMSWGYSDQQLFPAMWGLVKTKTQEPFLMMLSTVDTHPPFDLARDMVPYQDGSNNILNSYHTADTAFGKWWQEFKQSPYYNNTIVVAVADHSAFPGAEIKKLFPAEAKDLSFYDENMFMMYVPNRLQATNALPKEINTYASSIDVVPTMLQLLSINVPNSLEGHSIFDNKNDYPNVLGMHEYGLYINEQVVGGRKVSYQIPSDILCTEVDFSKISSTPLTLCEYLEFYKWKRQMFEQGRFWGK